MLLYILREVGPVCHAHLNTWGIPPGCRTILSMTIATVIVFSLMQTGLTWLQTHNICTKIKSQNGSWISINFPTNIKFSCWFQPDHFQIVFASDQFAKPNVEALQVLQGHPARKICKGRRTKFWNYHKHPIDRLIIPKPNKDICVLL